MTDANSSSRPAGDGWTPLLVLKHLEAIVAANDRRYGEQFSSSERGITTAFIASEKSTAQAFASSEKAIRDALAAVEKSTGAAFVAAEKAVALAEANAERWRQDAQEWRSRMTEREKSFATSVELGALKERLDRGEGSKAGVGSVWAWIVSGVSVIAAIASFFIHKGS